MMAIIQGFINFGQNVRLIIKHSSWQAAEKYIDHKGTFVAEDVVYGGQNEYCPHQIQAGYSSFDIIVDWRLHDGKLHPFPKIKQSTRITQQGWATTQKSSTRLTIYYKDQSINAGIVRDSEGNVLILKPTC